MNNEDPIRLIDASRFTLPPKIYKYRKWDTYGKEILQDNKIYFASPSSFIDFHDCNVPVRFPKKEELYDFFFKQSEKKYPKEDKKFHHKYAAKWSKESPLADPKERDELVKITDIEFFNRFGVFSTTTNPDNDRMWKEYSEDGNGICIGFDSALLSTVVGGGGPCIYVDNLPIINFGEDDNLTEFYKRIIYKKRDYEFEQEYRIHMMWPHSASPEERAIPLHPNTIIEVILGKNMSVNDKSEAYDIVRRIHPNAKIFRR